MRRTDEYQRRYRLAGFAVTALVVACMLAGAMRADVPSTPEAIEAERNAVSERTDLDETVRQQVLALYDDARQWAQAAQSWRDQALQHEQAREQAPADREQLQADLAQPMETRIAVAPDATLTSLRQSREQAEAALNSARERLTELQRERDRRTERRAEIPTELANARDELDDVQRVLDAAPPPDLPSVVRRAMLTERLARGQKLEALIDALTKELANYDARSDLMPLRLERANRRVMAREAQLREWRKKVDERAQTEAQQQAREARRAVAEAHPVVRDIAEQVVVLIERRTGRDGVLSIIPRFRGFAEQSEARLLDMMAQYERDRQRIETATRTGLTDVRLRNQREVLVEVRRESEDYQRRAQSRLASVQRERIDLEYERRALPPLTTQRDAILNQLGPEVDDATRTELAVELERQLTELRTQYDELIEAYRTLEQHLLDIERSLTPLMRLTKEYQRLIDERILWIRSMDPIGTADTAVAWSALSRLLDVQAWGMLGREQWRHVRDHWTVPLLAALILGTWFVRRHRRTKRMRELAEQVSSFRTDQFQHTLEATLYTVSNALFWPVVLWIIAWQLTRPAEPSDLAQQVASGLNRTAWVLLLFTFMLQFARNSGLAKSHFRWRDDTRNMLRWNLRWLGFIVLPLSFIMAASEWEMLRSGNDPLARFAFLAAMIVLAIFVAIVMRPHKGVLRHAVAASQSAWIDRLRYLWYGAAVLIPVALGVLAASGYFYTALQLEDHLVGTFGLIIALILVNGLVLRWLFMAQRQMAFAEAKRKREEAQQQAATEAADELSTKSVAAGQAAGAEGGTVTIDETRIDLQLVNSQTRKVLRTCVFSAFLIGLWLIWSNMLPAINMLDRVEIWPRFGNVREAAVATPPLEALVGREWAAFLPPPFAEPQRPFDAADQAQLAAAAPIEEVVTLTNVLICVLIVIVAFLIGRNIPGLLEITVLQRLPLQDSARYAIVTLTRYFVIIIGTILAFGAIGIGWTQVQWLVAAITLGIGFGLQEIVANFISGIIILFEQPIRVGDTVTVGNTSGTVTKIRMRATTIVDWDRKEILIPNKTFITGDVVNWTLNDPVLRIVIPVGIAYGSDTLKAEQTLMRVADEHPIVLKDPPPSVVFSEFGDSSLNFNLRVFIPNISELIKVRHEMHRAIDQAFREANIEIAFPQRDIHVRTLHSALDGGRKEQDVQPTKEDGRPTRSAS